MTNPLICVPSPRDIPEVHTALNELSYDKFIVKYHRASEAYSKIRRFFLSHKEYDILVNFADDLIVHPEGLEQLLEYHKVFLTSGANATISGICNFDMWKNSDKYCFKLEGHSDFPPIEGFDEYIEKYQDLGIHPYYSVDFNAFACMVTPRWIIEKIPFRFDEYEAGVDQYFAEDCKKEGIKLYVDTSVRFQHLAMRKRDNKLENSGLGIKPPYEVFRHR